MTRTLSLATSQAIMRKTPFVVVYSKQRYSDIWHGRQDAMQRRFTSRLYNGLDYLLDGTDDRRALPS